MKITRRTILKTGAAGVSAAIAGSAYSTLIEPGCLSVERVIVRLPGLPTALEGLRIAALGDFHLQPFTQIGHVQDAVRLANSLRADLTVLLGDYVDATVDAIYELAPELARLNSRLGVFGVLGNHDHWKGAKLVQSVLEGAGIPILRNSGVAIPVGGSEFFLAGLDSAWSGYPTLDPALGRRRDGVPTVLLIHEPDYADTAAEDGRIALQISGHSHGGQVRLPFIGALRLPNWGRRYDQGLYRVGDMALYTNRGIGLVHTPIRFNCPPEVTEITLSCA